MLPASATVLSNLQVRVVDPFGNSVLVPDFIITLSLGALNPEGCARLTGLLIGSTDSLGVATFDEVSITAENDCGFNMLAAFMNQPDEPASLLIKVTASTFTATTSDGSEGSATGFPVAVTAALVTASGIGLLALTFFMVHRRRINSLSTGPNSMLKSPAA